MPLPMVDVLIIGGGPSGLSAALTLVRQNHSVIIFDTQNSRTSASFRLHGITNWENRTPCEYFDSARAELRLFQQATFVDTEVIQLIKHNETIEAISGDGGNYSGRKIILANGVQDKFPNIDGYRQAWGKGIFHNLFAQGRKAGIDKRQSSGVLAVDLIAIPKYTLHIAHMAAQLTQFVTIYTNGNTSLAASLTSKPLQDVGSVKIDNRTITRLDLESPTATTVNIYFTDGSVKSEEFIGHAPYTQVNGPFAEQLGIELTEGGSAYKVSGLANATNVKGVYAAGDVVNVFKVWPNAIATGATTAAGVAVVLQEESWGLDSVFG